MGCLPGRAEGTEAISIPPVATGLDLQPPPFPTSSQNTNVSFCQLPESSIPKRKISAPFGEEPFQALVQLPAHGGQIPAATPAPDPARSCSASPRWSSTATASLVCLCCSSYFGIWLSSLSAPRFPPSPSVVCSWQRGGGVGPLPRGGRASPNAHAEGKENVGN